MRTPASAWAGRTAPISATANAKDAPKIVLPAMAQD
jgi:hypothetical protein